MLSRPTTFHCTTNALFYVYGSKNYSRFLTWFDGFLTNIEYTHPGATKLLESGAIAVARSLVSGNLSMIDKTMEESLMFFGKSKQGAVGAGFSDLMHNHTAYQRRLRTTSKRAAMHQKLLEQCNINDPFSDCAEEHHEAKKQR